MVSRLTARVGLLTLAAALGPPSVDAQPTVRVRAETRIELRAALVEGEARVRGILRDDLGVPLSGRRVELGLYEGGSLREARHAFTHADGAFEGAFALRDEPGEPRLRARFDGDPTHEGVQAERPIGQGLRDVRLEVELADAGRLDLDQPEHVLRVTVDTEGPPPPLRLEVLDELDRPLASGVTDASGHGSFRIPSDRLGAPGPGRITVRAAADATHPETQTEVPVVRVRRTALTLTASRSRAAPGEAIVLRGTLADRLGPLDARAVGLYRGEEHLDTVLTDHEGSFEHVLEAEAEPTGAWSLHARFESSSPGRLGAISAPVTIAIAARTPPPAAWLLVPMALCVFVLAVLARRSRAGGARSPAPRAEPPVGVRAEVAVRGRPSQAFVAGEVVDYRDDRPLPSAMIALTAPDGSRRELSPDADGRFRSPDLPPGPHRLHVEAPGYEAVEAVLRVPHRGEWARTTVRLRSLRARALAAFRRFVSPLLPSEAAWGVSTNREIAERAPSERRLEVAEIEAKVELAYYGPEAPSVDAVEAIEAEVAATEGRWREGPPAR